MAIDPRTPVIVGVGQRTSRRDDLPSLEPLEAWVAVSRSAAEDAGLPDAALAGIDFLAAGRCMNWLYDDAVGRLAERLGASPRGRFTGAPSGTSGHVMLHRAADAIRAGQAEMALICGGESLATAKAHARAGEPLPWSHAAPPEVPNDMDRRRLPAEEVLGLTAGIGAVYGFAMRDVARRAHLGIAPEDYRDQIGAIASGMTKVAASNPDAWFPIERDAGFLTGRRPDNRMVAYPYTKHLVSVMDVDIAGAVLLMSEAAADRLGVARASRIYPWTACMAEDPVYTAVRPDLWQSAAMRAASAAVLRAAAVAMDDVAHVDLYSCFPAAVNFARDALGIQDRTGDRLTVTGGLPYAGGPGSSYVLTSLTHMTRRLRSDPGAIGLVSGLGKQMAHHAYGLYSSEPPPAGCRRVDEAAVQRDVDQVPQIRVRDEYAGPASVATYTLIYDRNDQATHGAAICDLPDGSRTYARMSQPDLLLEAESTELVGRKVDIVASPGVNEMRF